MTDIKFNLLHECLINTAPLGTLSLPGVLAALSRDDIDSFPALRPHQAPLWHMFLVQLAALALHGKGQTTIPADRSEEHTSELQSREKLVCRLVLEKKNKNNPYNN